MSNINLINAILYVAENGCKWRALLKEYGNWHTIYVRLNRWSKNKVLERLFIGLHKEKIINVNMKALSIDSVIVKVHHDKLDWMFYNFIYFVLIIDILV